jgi:hypothetical protein
MSAPRHTAQARDELERYLAALAGREPTGGLLELRFRRGPGRPMRQRFYPAARARRLAETALWLSQTSDVYVGVLPRRRRAGGKAALERAWVLWADCDTSAAAAELERFEPAPAVVVASGGDGARHAYWLLERPIDPIEAEERNRAVARALGADERSCDAARILRPPGTVNRKYDPPRPVTLEALTGEVFAPAAVSDHLPAPPIARGGWGRGREQRRSDDPLLALEPRAYVEALTDLRVGRDGKVSCPLHEDSTPSLHVYETPAGGWYCFGCGRGTSVYDLAAAIWRLEPRGADFLELRRRLYELLLPGIEPPGAASARDAPPSATRAPR